MNQQRAWENTEHRLHGDLQVGEETWIPLEELRHLLIVGRSGKGKSRLLQAICEQLVMHPEEPALVLIDPPGLLADAVFNFCAANGLTERLIRFDPLLDPVIGYNPLERLAVSNFVLSILKAWKQFSTDQTPRLRRVLTSLAIALKEANLTLAEAPALLDWQPNPVRSAILERIQNPVARAEWLAIDKMNLRDRTAIVESTLSRIRAFVDEPYVRPIITRQQRTLNLTQALTQGQIILAPLRMPAALTTEAGYLLGSLLVSEVIQTAFELNGAKPIILMIDEFSQFVTPDIGFLLDAARKVNLKCILAHQHLSQVKEEDPKVYAAALTNPSHHLLMGGLSNDDLEILASEFFIDEWDFDQRKLELYHTYFAPVESSRTVSGRSWGQGSGQSSAAGATFAVNDGLFGPDVNEEHYSQHESSGETASRFEGGSEVEVPFYEFEERHELGSVQFVSPEELKLRSMVRLKKLKPREFALKGEEGPTQFDRTLDIPTIDPLPALTDEATAAVLRANDCYARIEEIAAEEAQRLKQLSNSHAAAHLDTGDDDAEADYWH